MGTILVLNQSSPSAPWGRKIRKKTYAKPCWLKPFYPETSCTVMIVMAKESFYGAYETLTLFSKTKQFISKYLELPVQFAEKCIF